MRGETIRSAHDVGWIRNLTVDKMMRADVRTAWADISLEDFKKKFPIGSAQRVILTDTNGRYAGLVLVPEVYGAAVETPEDEKGVLAFRRYENDVLLPTMNARQAAALFDATESEALAVVSDLIERRVIGQLSEAHTLRRYSEELDKSRRELSGEL